MQVKIRHHGIDYCAEAQIIKNLLWVHHNGKTFSVEAQVQGRKSRKAGVAATSDKIIAPMPGRITKILVVPDEKIEKGQAVLVMEAMKMEYTLKAEIAGKIATIHGQVGEQVVLGKILAHIEATKS